MPEHIKKKLLEEIQVLEHELAHELPAEIKKAVAMGDLSENAEYHMAKQRQDFVNARLGQLKRRMAELSLVNLTNIPKDKTGFGSTVVVYDSTTIGQPVPKARRLLAQCWYRPEGLRTWATVMAGSSGKCSVTNSNGSPSVFINWETIASLGRLQGGVQPGVGEQGSGLNQEKVWGVGWIAAQLSQRRQHALTGVVVQVQQGAADDRAPSYCDHPCRDTVPLPQST